MALSECHFSKVHCAQPSMERFSSTTSCDFAPFRLVSARCQHRVPSPNLQSHLLQPDNLIYSNLHFPFLHLFVSRFSVTQPGLSTESQSQSQSRSEYISANPNRPSVRPGARLLRLMIGLAAPTSDSDHGVPTFPSSRLSGGLRIWKLNACFIETLLPSRWIVYMMMWEL